MLVWLARQGRKSRRKADDLMEFLFVSRNLNKLSEAAAVLAQFGIELRLAEGEKKLEIQSNELEEIVSYALLQIKPKKGKCFIIEDDGIFIEALNGFPGPYSAQVFSAIGLQGILRLLEGASSRRAYFKSVVGMLMPDGTQKLFTGISAGSIANVIAKGREFGYDPIFIPEGSSKTFAEMPIEHKSAFSHRGKAFLALGNYIKENALNR